MNTSVENLRVTGAGRHISAQAHRAALAASAHSMLLLQMQDALLNDPTRIVRAPGFCKPHTAAEVILDAFSGASGERALLELLQFVGRRAKAGDTEAQLWISVQAAAHARYHLSDLVAQLEGEE
jgi:hypothetical protein